MFGTMERPLLLSVMPNPERINIKDLTIEEPERKKGLLFDAEKEITDEDWEELKNTFSGMREREGSLNLMNHAMAMKILSSERVKELRFGEEDWTNSKFLYEIHRARGSHTESFDSLAIAMRVVFPERASELRLDETLWESYKRTIEQYKLEENWLSFHALAVRAKILFPKKFGEEITLDRKSLEELKKAFIWYREDNNWDSFIRRTFQAKILYPESLEEFNIDDATWKNMKKKLQESRKGKYWIDFAEYAMFLKLLAAEEIKITNKGLEVIMQKEEAEFKEETPPMPQTRKF